MLFNSFEFAVFLPLVFALYWMANRHLRIQNILLLAASYYFYACWDWRFLFLLLFSTALDYTAAHCITKANSASHRRIWLWLSIGINVGFLAVFKYFNFFSESFTQLLSGFGLSITPVLLDVILPVGISFYTFHGLSYIIDVYRRRTEAESDFVAYGVFVAYFPLLVAGPIERATHLLPQVKKRREFRYHQAVDGLRQILWGLFKKIVIADNCSVFVDQIFHDPAAYSGSTLALGAFLFAVQIYGDFSGYSDIALGVSKLFGIELLRNFSFPYFSRDIAEFWRRWHMSLSSWFRDYLYIPLGGSKGGKWMRIRNTFAIFLVSGFWHGANWTYLFWGFLNAVYFLPLLLSDRNRTHLDSVATGRIFPSLRELVQVLITFCLSTLAWIFFRAPTLESAFSYCRRLFSPSLFSLPEIRPFYLFVLLFVFFVIEWLGRESVHPLERIVRMPRVVRWTCYIGLLVVLFVFRQMHEVPFIYFQY